MQNTLKGELGIDYGRKWEKVGIDMGEAKKKRKEPKKIGKNRVKGDGNGEKIGIGKEERGMLKEGGRVEGGIFNYKD